MTPLTLILLVFFSFFFSLMPTRTHPRTHKALPTAGLLRLPRMARPLAEEEAAAAAGRQRSFHLHDRHDGSLQVRHGSPRTRIGSLSQ